MMQMPTVSFPNRSSLAVVLFLAWCGTFVGCSLCPSPYDCDYGGFGSRTPRTDMRNGRVGSIFSDPALVGTNSTTTSTLSEGDVYYEGEIIDGMPLDSDYEGIEIQEPEG